MIRRLLAILTATVACCCPVTASLKTLQQADFDGIGDVRIGMSLWELIRALDLSVSVLSLVDEECTFVLAAPEELAPALPPGLSFMVISDRLVRLDIDRPGIRTIRGIQVGDSEAEVHAAYPGLVEVQDHAYIDGHYLIVRDEAKTSAVVFETDGAVVLSYRIGKEPEVELVEGCS